MGPLRKGITGNFKTIAGNLMLSFALEESFRVDATVGEIGKIINEFPLKLLKIPILWFNTLPAEMAQANRYFILPPLKEQYIPCR
jgi:hypothetical protein